MTTNIMHSFNLIVFLFQHSDIAWAFDLKAEGYVEITVPRPIFQWRAFEMRTKNTKSHSKFGQ